MAKTIDPVCGMAVDTETAPAKAQYESRTYYFCAEACAKTFRANPERFIGSELEQHEPPFTTEGMTAPKFGSAGSGGAEYERLPERHNRR